MGFKTRGRVVGVNGTRDVIQTAQGSLFTEVSATNAEQGGTLVVASVHPDGHGSVAVKVNGKTVHEFVFDPQGMEVK